MGWLSSNSTPPRLTSFQERLDSFMRHETRHPIFQQAGDDLFGIEAGRLLSQVDITVDLARD